MELDILRSVVPAVIAIAVVLALEDWAFFKAKSKLQRAVIVGGAVFVLILIFNVLAGPSF